MTLDETGSFISIISKIELLGWQAPTAQGNRKVENFVADGISVPLADLIAEKAIKINTF